MVIVTQNSEQSKEFDIQQIKKNESSKDDLFNMMYKQSLDEVLENGTNNSEIDHDKFNESQNLSLALKRIEQLMEFQHKRKEFIDNYNKNTVKNGKLENIYNLQKKELQETHSAGLQKITKEIEKNMSKKFENDMCSQLIAQPSGYDTVLSKKSVEGFNPSREYLEQIQNKLKNIKSTQQQMTVDADVEITNIPSKVDVEGNELIKQNGYLCSSAKNQEEVNRFLIEIEMYRKKHNMSDKNLEITTHTDSVQKTDMMNENLELKDEVLKLKLENQQYKKMIEKLSYEENKHRKCENENSRNQKAKLEKYESDMLTKRILALQEVECWQQRFERSQMALMKIMIEKQEAEMKLIKFTREMTKLQKLCNIFEKENLLRQLKNKNNKASSNKDSFNTPISQKNILQKENRQTSPKINSASSNLQETLEEQIVPEVIPKVIPEVISEDSAKDCIPLSSKWRQVILQEGDYNRITSPTINIADAETDKAMESPKQTNEVFNIDSLKKLIIGFEDKMKKILNNESIQIMKLLETPKTNDKSSVVEEQLPTFSEFLNKDCITSTSVMWSGQEKYYDDITLSPTNITDKESDKVEEPSKQVDEDVLTESLDFETDINEILNKETFKVMELLEDRKMNDASIVVEQIQNKDKVADYKTETTGDGTVCKENLIFSLPDYESSFSTENQRYKKYHIMKNVLNTINEYDACQSKNLMDIYTSQQSNNELDLNEEIANTNNNHINCNYCIIAKDILKDILMAKHNNMKDHEKIAHQNNN